MARLSLESVQTLDGYRVAAYLYAPFARGKFNEVAVLNSGAGIPRALYESFASWLADSGVPTITYDYRGIGASRGRSIRGLDASIRDWGSKDCAAVLEWLCCRYPDARIYVIGHSIGGLVTGFVKNPPPSIDRMLLISPHTGYWGDYAPSARKRMLVQWHVMLPIVTRVMGYFPGRILGFPEDIPYGVAMEWALRTGGDGTLIERLLRWGTSSSMKPLEDAGSECFPRFTSSILALRPSDDPFATKQGLRRVQSLFYNCVFADVQIDANPHGQTRIGHFGFFGTSNRDSLWTPALAWLRTGQWRSSRDSSLFEITDARSPRSFRSTNHTTHNFLDSN